MVQMGLGIVLDGPETLVSGMVLGKEEGRGWLVQMGWNTGNGVLMRIVVGVACLIVCPFLS